MARRRRVHFVDFLVPKHGLAEALQSDDAMSQILPDYFVDRLVPVGAQLLDASAEARRWSRVG